MRHGHLDITDINSDNLRYYVEKPDKNFSPERNYAVISQVIKENDKMQYGVDRKVQENAGNVADILASFAKYKLDIGGGKQIEEYLGPHWMTRIYGEKLIEKIRIREALQQANRKRGNTLFGGNFYLK